MKVLVIDDGTDLAKGIKRGLEQSHFDVDTAEDGASGLEKALHGEYSLIVLDLMPAGMDGLRICEELRARRRTVLILMPTARGAVSDRIRGLEIDRPAWFCLTL